jgi:serine/threonine-protein kinase
MVQIHELGSLPDKTAYIVMEYLDGMTLAKCLQVAQGPLELHRALQYCWQIAAALAEAHAKGIVHRDLKPANVMLIRDALVPGGERVKILDFGIAKLATDARHGKTATHILMGTPSYMSPEQCRGAGTVDEKSDVYSLGILMFLVLSGRLPFDAEGAGELIAMHLHQAPPSLLALVPGIPPVVAALVHRLLVTLPQFNGHPKPSSHALRYEGCSCKN